MPFKKGDRNINRSGRPKLGNDISSVMLRNRVKELLNDNFEKLEKELSESSGKTFLTYYTQLLEYSIPKLQRQEPVYNFDDMNEEVINHLFEMIMDKIKEAA